jgi:cell wall-associated NlpC family hydrolase
VVSLLARTQDEFDSVNATVRRLAAEYQARQARLAAERARIQLASIGALGDVAPGNRFAVEAIDAARSRIGLPYVWGATGPDVFDCSGLTQWAYRQAGASIDRTSRQQWFNGSRVALADLAPGDLLFWAYDTSDPSTIHHVALYIGAGRMIEAPRTGLTVREIPVYLDGYIGAVRPGGAAGSPAPAPTPSPRS